MATDSWLLDVWREACQHLDLGELIARLAPLVKCRWPVSAVAVARQSPDAKVMELVGPLGDGDVAADQRRELTSADSRLLGAWLAQGQTEIIANDGRVPSGVATLLPAAYTRAGTVIAPLTSSDEARGLLVVVPADSEAPHGVLPAVEQLRAPLAAALANDRRLRELVDLRRAAEADRRSLLTRLGRDELLETIVGADGGLRGVMARVAMVAASDIPVLILGETGAGKEVVARAVHARSRRAHGPFTRVNCGAIPPELVDSELFGHEKGSFTGAMSRRRGWFERSDQGTLLLDEVGELPKAAQVRLLRVIQDGMLQRVGGESMLRVDVRIIAATHADLAAMVQRGEFREDLWYRLAVFPLVLPPLRERTEDIPDLVAMLARRASRRFGLRPQRPTAADLALLAAYPWPGNVRELGSVIDRAAILGDGKCLDIAKALGSGGPGMHAGAWASSPRATSATPEALASLDAAMAAHIRAALIACDGRIEGAQGAAVLLCINPHTLRARMRKLGLEWARYRVHRSTG